MPSLNKAMIMGHLGGDPDVRYLPDGKCVANVSIATSEKWKDSNGEKQEKTTWHRVVFFGKLAEVVAQYLKKGAPVFVEGRIDIQKWTDKDGIDRWSAQIIAREMQMLGGKREGSTDRPPEPPPLDDDIPFAVAWLVPAASVLCGLLAGVMSTT